jgi:hypothetical protein
MSKAPREFKIWRESAEYGEQHVLPLLRREEKVFVIEKTPEVAKAVNRDHLFEELVRAVDELCLMLKNERWNDEHIRTYKDLLQRAKAAK